MPHITHFFLLPNKKSPNVSLSNGSWFQNIFLGDPFHEKEVSSNKTQPATFPKCDLREPARLDGGRHGKQ